jgi:predicted glycosyltransferase
VRQTLGSDSALRAHLGPAKKIWIDLDNSPHVPFFFPIIRELEARGHEVCLTARDCFQVRGLADYYNLTYRTIGTHYGANKLFKVAGTLWRSVQLLPFVLKAQPDISMSHGSRPLVLISSLLRIPTMLLFDYEYAKLWPVLRPTLGVVPETIRDRTLASHFRHGLRHYTGLKEDVYVSSFKPDATILADLRIAPEQIIATIRPPATEAHYHNPEADHLFIEVVDFLGTIPDLTMVILPRNQRTQTEFIRRTWPTWCAERKIVVPDQVLDGANLVWHSDFVVSGGGTMNREAAALGVPVYSIFRGKIGAVDRYLAQRGRLTLIESAKDVRAKIRPVRREKTPGMSSDGVALKQILETVNELMLFAESRHPHARLATHHSR